MDQRNRGPVKAQDGYDNLRKPAPQDSPLKRGTIFGATALFATLYVMLLARPAYGYVDPNATNLITQVLTPLLVVAAAGLTFLRKQTRSAIGWLADRILRRKK